MADTIRAAITEAGSPRQKFLGLKKVAILAGQTVPENWHRLMLPNHFRRGAVSKYKYEYGTTEIYNRVKRASGGLPLVKTGALREAVSAAVRSTARSIRETVKGKYRGPAVIRMQGQMDAPRYAYILQHLKAGARYAIIDDIVAVTDHETNLLANKFREEVVVRLDRVRPKHRKTVTR